MDETKIQVYLNGLSQLLLVWLDGLNYNQKNGNCGRHLPLSVVQIPPLCTVMENHKTDFPKYLAMKEDSSIASTAIKFMLLGILLVLGGVASIAGYVLVPGFLWGASLSGIAGLLAPFGLIFLGGILILASLYDVHGKKPERKHKKPPPPPPPPPS
jgi:hypothetical protein